MQNIKPLVVITSNYSFCSFAFEIDYNLRKITHKIINPILFAYRLRMSIIQAAKGRPIQSISTWMFMGTESDLVQEYLWK